jgi:hypothetical protein
VHEKSELAELFSIKAAGDCVKAQNGLLLQNPECFPQQPGNFPTCGPK